MQMRLRASCTAFAADGNAAGSRYNPGIVSTDCPMLPRLPMDAAPRCAPRRLAHPLFRATASLVLVVSLAACGGDKEDAKAAGGGDRPIPVTTQVLQPESFAERTSAVGTVKARESVTLTAKVSELVDAVHFESGQEVRAGAPLVTLSDRQQRAALAEAQASADEAERLYRRQSELAEQQLIARAQFDNQRAARDAADARVAQIRAQLADRVIRAPFAGTLGIRQVSPGALIAPGTVVATLDDVSRVFVDFPLPEGQLSTVAAGRAITGRAEAWPGRTFTGNVATVDARIEPATRSVLVRADLPNPDRLLRPGMLLEVELPGASREALRVPEIAVVQVGRDSFLYRAKDDGSVEQVGVTLGARADGKVEIVSGVRAGDRVVVEGTGKLRPGAKIVDAKAPAPAADAAAPAPAASKG